LDTDESKAKGKAATKPLAVCSGDVSIFYEEDRYNLCLDE
jgi:hypothetical protein